ncbi:hypothetical protein CS0771_14370 [Catellatospora sp. IY07-71]|uniref:DUF559 domain-containing protein n=1 Tax=Catellatospora sp. IY07-71 TaxID=2728827 RepID=UPI001BB50EFA|nr:DUF559 domain-containing protein [Catellatospora sp. IY07-71]BCJ71893.1 hypothetical protein CS0771_14370 [Catellatospora sp. IY07-71]
MFEVQRIAETQDGLITAAQCRALGIAADRVKWFVRSRLWMTVTRGVYLVDADLRGTVLPLRALVRAGRLACGPEAVVVLHSAALLHGIDGLRQDERAIHLSLPGDRAIPKRLGDGRLMPHQLVIDPADIVEIDGMRVTSALRTVADLLLVTDRYAAVSVLDSALHRLAFTEHELPGLYRLLAGRRGAIAARKWIDQADGRAESPLETRARLRCADAGLAPDELQAVIRAADGTVLARADMLWHRARVIGEADGAEVHDRPEAVFRDRHRQNALANAGYTVLRFTWSDTLTPDRIPTVVRRALVGSQQSITVPG